MKDDTISRQDAIDAMCELMHHWFGGNPKDEVREIVRELKKLPAVQPQQTCEYWDSENKFCALCRPAAQPEKRTETHACDSISRQAAITILDAWLRVHGGAYGKGLSAARELIADLPAVQPQRKTDEWCTDCREYDQEKHCCPRWNRVIRETLKDAQPEIIRCKDCKWCEDADGSMCKNPASWVVATDCDFGCVLAERRTDEQSG